MTSYVNYGTNIPRRTVAIVLEPFRVGHRDAGQEAHQFRHQARQLLVVCKSRNKFGLMLGESSCFANINNR
jgi:hypothetical protein